MQWHETSGDDQWWQARRQCWEVKFKIIKVGMSLEETLIESQYDGVMEFVNGKNQWKSDGFCVWIRHHSLEIPIHPLVLLLMSMTSYLALFSNCFLLAKEENYSFCF